MNMKYDLPIALIVSSSLSKMDFLRKCLRSFFHIVESEDSKSALEHLEASSIRLIIIDEKGIDLPAIQLCKKIRLLSQYSTTPILMISNNLKKKFIFQALNAGITDFLNEPLDEVEIQQRIAVAEKMQELQKKMHLLTDKIKKTSSIGQKKNPLNDRFLLNNFVFKEIEKAKKQATPLGILMLEIDDIKQLDQNWGIPAVDELITLLNYFLKKALRKFDALFPQGRGRYILILPKTSSRAAYEIGDSLRKDINSHSFTTQKGIIPLTVSIGLTNCESKTEDSRDLRKICDEMLNSVGRALIKAQKRGNRIEFL